MSSLIDVINAPAADWTPGDQICILAWVLDELRKSLGGAVKSMAVMGEAEYGSGIRSGISGCWIVAHSKATVAPGQRCAGNGGYGPSSSRAAGHGVCGTKNLCSVPN